MSNPRLEEGLVVRLRSTKAVIGIVTPDVAAHFWIHDVMARVEVEIAQPCRIAVLLTTLVMRAWTTCILASSVQWKIPPQDFSWHTLS